MKLVIFGLTISSSWGNGHATLWRGLCRALARRGHEVVFFERDVPYYAMNRDLAEIPGGELVLYDDWEGVLPKAKGHLAEADVAMVTSYCPDAAAASELVLDSRAVRTFYDLDTPVTLDNLRAGRAVAYVPPGGLGDFDLVLSYTGGGALEELRTRLGARRVAPLYGSVDPEAHLPAGLMEVFKGDLSYLGTYAEDRQAGVEAFFVEPARRLPGQRFVLAGAQYPPGFPWRDNIYFVKHLEPSLHPAFYCSSRFTLNVTRRAMAEMGYCPSGRLFEAAACGTAIISDAWEGLDLFFEPGREIVVARTTEDVVEALRMPVEEVGRMARAARERTLEEHTAERRAVELEEAVGRSGGGEEWRSGRAEVWKSGGGEEGKRERGREGERDEERGKGGAGERGKGGAGERGWDGVGVQVEHPPSSPFGRVHPLQRGTESGGENAGASAERVEQASSILEG